jgi:hypothetical protein
MKHSSAYDKNFFIVKDQKTGVYFPHWFLKTKMEILKKIT